MPPEKKTIKKARICDHIFGRKFNMNISEFYIAIFARKMTEFYTIIARLKLLPDFFFGGGGRHVPHLPPPVSYATGLCRRQVTQFCCFSVYKEWSHGVGHGFGSSMGWVGSDSIFCFSEWFLGSIFPEMYKNVKRSSCDFLLIVNSCQNGSGRVDGYNFLMGRVGLGHFYCGWSRVGSKNLDPCPTLWSHRGEGATEWDAVVDGDKTSLSPGSETTRAWSTDGRRLGQRPVELRQPSGPTGCSCTRADRPLRWP